MNESWDTTETMATIQNEGGYVPLDLSGLRLSTPLSSDLYILSKGKYILYREASLPFTSTDHKRLLSSRVTTLWIRVTSPEALRPDLLPAFLSQADSQVPPKTKATLLYESTLNAARNVITYPFRKEALVEATGLVSTTVGYLSRSPAAFHALLSVMLHDYSVYTHAVNVATYALGLGRVIGITNEEELQNLGLGALLHDVGKARVPSEILNKRGPLSPDDWAVMRKHPAWGRESLSKAVDLPEVVATIVKQHHERLDGSGYPCGISGNELHQFSMIVSLVDAYDAMTSDRPYRRAMTPFEALRILKQQVQDKLDPALFVGLVLLLGDAGSNTNSPSGLLSTGKAS